MAEGLATVTLAELARDIWAVLDADTPAERWRTDLASVRLAFRA